ncbi:MAG: hypothetical protein P8173_18350, partial [Gammaproteobacteria bacterium]
MKKRRLISAVLALASLFVMADRVEATPYSVSVDQFRFQGFGKDFTDNFDNGILDPWHAYSGTAVESGGVVTLSGGIPTTSFPIGNTLLAGTFAQIEPLADNPFVVGVGASGNFRGTSAWLPIIPAVNQSYRMKFTYDLSPNLDEQFSVEISNYDYSVLSAFSNLPFNNNTSVIGPFAGGALAISFERTIGDNHGHPIENTGQGIPISAQDITGDIF